MISDNYLVSLGYTEDCGTKLPAVPANRGRTVTKSSSLVKMRATLALQCGAL
jgi:hypothetical protein